MNFTFIVSVAFQMNNFKVLEKTTIDRCPKGCIPSQKTKREADIPVLGLMFLLPLSVVVAVLVFACARACLCAAAVPALGLPLEICNA